MKIVKKYEMLQPKTGETHRLFGIRYLYRHKMRDKRWTAADKLLQYSGLARLYERDHALQSITNVSERKHQYKLLKDLKKELKDKNLILNKALHGDAQRIKNMIQHDKYMRRSYPRLNSYKIVERIDDKTYMMRKQLDKLLEQKRRLTELYEQRIIEVANFEDRIKYQDSLEPKAVIEARRFEADLKNSETRIRAISSINRAYKKIINAMLKDSIYYDSVLDALKNDLDEQEMFIQKTILLGKPALATAVRLEDTYSILERTTKKDMDRRIKDLLEHREKIATNNERVRTLVRRDDDFEIDPTRYNRDTPSITQLKLELEQVEKSIKDLKLATITCDSMEIYPKMKEQTRKNKRIIDHINRREKEKNLAKEKDTHANVIEESLKYDLTDDEIAKLGNIDSMKKQIAEEKEKQRGYEMKIKERADNFVLIRLAFQHVIEVLDTIGKPVVASGKKLKGSMLDLPLLKFDKIVQKYKPPQDYEHNIDNLLKAAKTKIDVVAKKYQTEYDKEISDDAKILDTKLKDPKLKPEDKEGIEKLRNKQKAEEDVHKWKSYHHAIVKELTSGYQAKEVEIEDKGPLVEGWEVLDPSVLTRGQIKALSAKIVDENLKKED